MLLGMSAIVTDESFTEVTPTSQPGEGYMDQAVEHRSQR